MLFNQDKKEEIKKIMAIIEKENVRYIHLQFVNIEGTLKSIGIALGELKDVLSSGQGFDGSSISGYGRLEESDMIAVPVVETFSLVPWGEGDKDGRFICSIYRPDGTRYEGDPRYVLEKQVAKAKKMGFTMSCSPELEFFILQQDESASTKKIKAIDYSGYFAADGDHKDHYIRREMALVAETFPNIKIETVHHEVAYSQHEISMKYNDVLTMADATITMKMVIKAIAAKHGYLATFMPKPWKGHNGSGMHVHQSLWDAKGNAFFDENDPNKISDVLRQFIAGQLKHAHSITGILNSWPNSFKRLVPGFEAPTLIAWGFKNRSMLVRVPNFFNKAKAARCEIRSPDGSGNPYLQFAALLGSGLDGIENKIQPPAPVDINLFHTSEEEREKMGIVEIPSTLKEALAHMEKSSFIKGILGEIAFEAYLKSKKAEDSLISQIVTDWELNRYSEIL